MNKERLAELQQWAQETTDVAATLEKLNNADPYRSGVQCSLRELKAGDALLDDKLLRKVIATGRLAVIDEYEQKLSELLGQPVTVAKDVMAAEDDPRISGEGAAPTPLGLLVPGHIAIPQTSGEIKGECPVCGFNARSAASRKSPAADAQARTHSTT